MKIIIDKNKLSEIRYKPAPIFQINNLPDLNTWHKNILISLFGHKKDWNLYGKGFKAIALSFTPPLNSSRVKIYMNEMIDKKYILVINGNYEINLELIQKNTTVTNRNYLVTNRN